MSESTLSERLISLMVDVPDFPKPGIVFKDITPALQDADSFRDATDATARPFLNAGITQIVGIESRGFLFGASVAYALGCGLTLVRKPGKLPRKVASVTYALEYGEDTLEIHKDALSPSDKVLIIDDVLATGGTAAATVKLVESLGAEVTGLAFLIELAFLNGRARIPGQNIHHLIKLD